MAPDEKRLLLRCVQCGELYVGSLTNNGDLVPDSTASGGRCHGCGGNEFEHVTLTPSD